MVRQYFPNKASVEQAAVLEQKTKPTAAKGLVLDGDDEDCVAMENPMPPPPKNLAGKKCELAVDHIHNKVAFGVAFPREGNFCDLIHGKDMPLGCLRVSVDGFIKEEALVPVPVVGEIETVLQAVGSHVAWPEKLISYPGVVIK